MPGRFRGVEIVLDVLVLLARVLAALVTGAAVAVALAMLVEAGLGLGALVVAGVRHVRERRGAAGAAGTPPSYTLALLVRLDEQTGRLCPSVQLRGGGSLTLPWIRLELVDRAGRVRLLRRKRLARTAIGTELPLPAFDPPDGASPDEVLGWHWDVVIEDKVGERARWRVHPRPAERLNAEAELAGA